MLALFNAQKSKAAESSISQEKHDDAVEVEFLPKMGPSI